MRPHKSAARALLALAVMASAAAHAGREEVLRERVMTRVNLLYRAADRCQQRISSGELDECDVNVSWEQRQVSIGEARRIAKEMHDSLSTQTIVVKSFIHHLDPSSLGANAKMRGEQLFAKMTNAGFSEQPGSPARGARDFRLWSEVKLASTCKGDRVGEWQIGELETEFGGEFGILGAYGEVMQPIATYPSLGGSGADRVEFSYSIKGRPNMATLPAFKAVYGRSCSWIWHKVEGTLRCRSGRPELIISTSGSRFPSHRTWVNDRQRPTIDQGPFATLWECDPSNQEMVR